MMMIATQHNLPLHVHSVSCAGHQPSISNSNALAQRIITRIPTCIILYLRYFHIIIDCTNIDIYVNTAWDIVVVLVFSFNFFIFIAIFFFLSHISYYYSLTWGISSSFEWNHVKWKCFSLWFPRMKSLDDAQFITRLWFNCTTFDILLR